jgi:hypothetical protein
VDLGGRGIWLVPSLFTGDFPACPPTCGIRAAGAPWCLRLWLFRPQVSR